MKTSLLPLQQICDNGLICEPMAKQFTQDKSLHGIYDDRTGVTLPFQLHGCISYLPIRLPTEEELNNCKQIELTSDCEWNQYSKHFIDLEQTFTPIVYDYTNTIEGGVISQVGATSSKEHRSSVDAPTLACCWGTSLNSSE
jgi:hypothetical protein